MLATPSVPSAPTSLIGLHLDVGEAAIAAAHLCLMAIMADLGGKAAPCEVIEGEGLDDGLGGAEGECAGTGLRKRTNGCDLPGYPSFFLVSTQLFDAIDHKPIGE